MIKHLLEELHAMPLDGAARDRLVRTHSRAVAEIEAELPEDLRTELDVISPHLSVGTAVTDAELRIAHAQLVGWLEGLFQGVQFAAMTGAGRRRQDQQHGTSGPGRG
ncbi:Protein of unknown function [Pseudonocardia thermophila]|jgi:Protein of unknown function (DUF2587).|uniref:Bacterial proteasome activator n=2 Tax=Pseudonocardia thermophila TaxID=1848 RepID=A0A1M6V2R9_PSETH|nr:Protein of unknown function [Pseudonocardia thermophila]